MDDPAVPALVGWLFLAGPLLVVPLGLRLLPELGSSLAARVLALAVLGSLPAGIVLAIAFLLPAGTATGLLAVPWLVVASLGALAAALDIVAAAGDGRLVRPGPRHATWAALVFLAIGAGNALADRLGVQPFGFAPLIVLLTAVHFTFAGFALVLVGTLLVAAHPARWLGVAIAVLVIGMPVTAAGFFGVRPAVLVGALLVATGGLGIGIALLRSVGGAAGLPRLLRGVAGLTLLVSMPLAALYAAGAHAGDRLAGHPDDGSDAWRPQRPGLRRAGHRRLGPRAAGGSMSRIAISGGSGFVGARLAERLRAAGDEVVILSRRTGVDLGRADGRALTAALHGCDALVHCAGINRELGTQTYQAVHVEGTRTLIHAARAAGVGHISLLSFLRARPDGPTAYHRSKWAAEELVRSSGLPYTILKAGVIHGRGDHLLDHLSHALHTFPVFGLVGRDERPVRPVAVDDVVRILVAAAHGDRRLRDATLAVLGPDQLVLGEAVRRVAAVVGREPRYVRLPVAVHLGLARTFEATMRVPLVSIAQVHILAEGVTEVAPFGSEPPPDLRPVTRFDIEAIGAGLPAAGGFTCRDLRWCPA